MIDVKELTRQQLIDRLVLIYRWESEYSDFDLYAAEVAAINALLEVKR